MFRGSRASSTPRLTPNPPKCRPIPPKAPILAVFTQWVCTLGTTPPRTAASPPPNGGNCIIRGATRRRHAASQLLMVQNPLASRSAEVRKVQPHREDSTRSEGVESSRSGVGLAATRTFMWSHARLAAVPAGGDNTAASQISHVIYRGHFSRCPKNVAIPTMPIQYLNQSERNYVRSC